MRNYHFLLIAFFFLQGKIFSQTITITGPSPVAPGAQETYTASFNYPNGTITWTAIGGTITSPQNNTTCTVLWNNTAGKGSIKAFDATNNVTGQLVVWRGAQPTVCPTANAGVDKVICPGNSTVIGTPAVAGNTYSWFPTTGLNNPNIAQPTASPTTTTIYTLSVASNTYPNLLTNGDFEGTGGFLTDYGAYPNGDGFCGFAGQYGSLAITANPPSLNQNWCNRTDHTASGTRMLAIDGSCSTSRRAWYTSPIAVSLNTNYTFSGWIGSLLNAGPSLNIKINGSTVTNFQMVGDCTNWSFFTVNWNSGGSNTAVIEIRSNGNQSGGNDFCMDDLSFRTCPTTSVNDDVTVTVASPPVVSPGSVTYYNAWESISYPVTITSTLAPSYQWYKNNVAIPGATSQTYIITYYSGLSTFTDSYKVVTPCGTSNVVPFNYIGCNTDAQYPVQLPPSVLCASTTYPIRIYAPNLGANASYQWWSESNPTCFSFAPSQSYASSTWFTVNFPCAPNTGGGIYTLSSTSQTQIYMYYRRQINSGCRPASKTQGDTDSVSKFDTLHILKPQKELNRDISPAAETLKKSVLVPNPASGGVLISSPNQIISVQIFNLSGVLVKTLKPNKSKSLSIDITKFNPGYYNCSVHTDKGKEDLKLLVQK